MADFLERGVQRFKREAFAAHRALFRRLASHQSPRVLFITCADSRVVPSLITQTKPGDIFVERNPGNIVPVYSRESTGVAASIEYAISVLGVEHVIVCGHSDCGAVKGILHPDKLAGVPAVSRWLAFGKPALKHLDRIAGDAAEKRRLELLTGLNVLVQLEHLMTHPAVKRAVRRDALKVYGWVYRIEDGEILQFDPATYRYRPWP